LGVVGFQYLAAQAFRVFVVSLGGSSVAEEPVVDGQFVIKGQRGTDRIELTKALPDSSRSGLIA
jgi:hypothetical protein